MDKVYRVEDSDGMGPYTSEIYYSQIRNFSSWDRPAWCKMLAEHQMSVRHPGPYADWGWGTGPFVRDGVTPYHFGCPNPKALLGWFSLLEDLVKAGFKIVELTVLSRFDSSSGYQCAFRRDAVDSKRELSYKEFVELASQP